MDLYTELVYDRYMLILHDWYKNNRIPMLRTVWYPKTTFDPKKNKWKAERKLVGFNNYRGDCYVEAPVKTGWQNHNYDWENDSTWMTIFKDSHLEYHRLITLKEGTQLIVVFPDKKEAYKATFVRHGISGGYGQYVHAKKVENGEDVWLHCYSYEGEWICFPAE